MKENKEKLYKWQQKFRKAKDDYSDELTAMTIRDKYYQGDKSIYSPDGTKSSKDAHNVRNICFEMIEAQVESTYPTVKVTPYREEDEELAMSIEDMIRNEMDRLPFERINDTDERTVTIQGGDFFLVEWDNRQRTHTTIGEVNVQLVHPRKVIPQQGVESLEQSDYVFIELAQTKEYIKSRYGVDVEDEDENDADIRGDGKSKSDNMVTQVIVYYRNKDNGIGLFSWVNDTIVEDLEDYQARVQKYCPKCDLNVPATADECPYCGNKKLQDSTEDYYEIDEDIVLYGDDGFEVKRIPAYVEELDDFGAPVMEDVLNDDGTPVMDVTYDEMGIPSMQTRQQKKMVKTKIPYYKPDIFPLIVRKNVSIDGKWLGNSDIDAIKDQQNEINIYNTKIAEKTMKGGSLVTLPRSLNIEATDEEMKLVKFDTPNQYDGIHVFNMQADFSGDIQMSENNYQYARQTIGITDSFQGRADSTATSGKAKEFSAAQAAGRFESKKVMKRAAYAELYECMFKFILAYADEQRSYKAVDKLGNNIYHKFDKYAFLEQDDAGEWYWNDRFMFSTDNTGNLSNNREAMWQETRSNFESGAFGNPQDFNTLIAYWTIMDNLHYPLAQTAKQNIQKIMEEQQQMQREQMQQQQMMAPPEQQMPGGMPGGMPPM